MIFAIKEFPMAAANFKLKYHLQQTVIGRHIKSESMKQILCSLLLLMGQSDVPVTMRWRAGRDRAIHRSCRWMRTATTLCRSRTKWNVGVLAMTKRLRIVTGATDLIGIHWVWHEWNRFRRTVWSATRILSLFLSRRFLAHGSLGIVLSLWRIPMRMGQRRMARPNSIPITGPTTRSRSRSRMGLANQTSKMHKMTQGGVHFGHASEDGLLEQVGRWAWNMGVATSGLGGTVVGTHLGATHPTRAAITVSRPGSRRPRGSKHEQGEPQ
jgi:hypothetical protein